MKAKVKKHEEKRIENVPEYKKKTVEMLAKKIKNSKTVLIVSTKGLPSSEFHKIKKSLRGRADIVVAKKSLVLRAISSVEKGSLQNLKEKVGADIALIFSEVDSFELAGILVDNQTPTKAKVGDIAPEDIEIEPGPTDMVPGPAISELGAVGLKVVVEGGKLAIKNSLTIVKKGEEISEKVANVLGKLKIAPMKVGFVPVAAYDSKDDKIYIEIKIDKKGTLEELRASISKALGFAVGIGYTTKETISFLIGKAAMQEKAIEKIYMEYSGNQSTFSPESPMDISDKTSDKINRNIHNEKSKTEGGN